MTTKNISEHEFNEYDLRRRLFVHDNARRFAALMLPGSKLSVAFNWRSDIVEPSVVADECSRTTWVGIDDRLAAVASDGRIVVNLELSSQLLTVELRGGKAVAICELQAIVVNPDGSIHATFDFPDAVDDFSIAQNSLSASFMDGNAAEYKF
ncbi:MAG: hypothetical protein ACK5PB_00635 [Pirellula sp.]|jgi:hypothetical protein